MLEQIKVRGFQSLHKIDLELAPFTTIIGASSSGKSAFIRALQLLTQNRRGTAFIEHGEQTAQVIATTQNGTVSIKRSRTSTGPNEYTVIPTEGDPQTWTKLHGETPEEVTAFLRVPPHKINVASQFDPPYLLSESAPEAARILGSLTNVHVIMEAGRESNRRKLAANAELKKNIAELSAIKERLPEFAKLKAKEDVLDRAEKILLKLRKAETQKLSLAGYLATAREAEEELAEASALLKVSEDLPEIRTIMKLDALAQDLYETVASAKMMQDLMTTAKARQESTTSAIVDLQGQYITLLTEAGTCPTCGQDTEGLHHD